jgi:hypothetical protein
MAPPI